MRTLPIEDAWRVLADGLHVHRYFLGPYPQRLHAEAAAYDAFIERTGASRAPALDLLRRQLPGGVLEHLLHPAQPDLDAVLAVLRDPPALPRLGDHAVAVADAGECINGKGPVMAAAALVHRRPGPFDQRFLDQAAHAVDHARLSYLIELMVDVILVGAPGEAGATGDPSATVIVGPTPHPFALGEQLVHQASTGLLALFAAESKREIDPADLRLAETALAASMSHRYLGAALATSPSALEEQGLGGRFGSLTRQLDEQGDDVIEAASRLGMNIADLVITSLPGPRQFEKYLNGMGPGQS